MARMIVTRPRRPLPHVADLGRAEGGNAAVEFAITAPLLVLLFAGTVSFGIALRLKTEVANAARAGARYAVLHGYNQATITSAAQSATALSSVAVSVSEVTASCSNPSSGAITSAGAPTCSATGSAPGTYVTVTTQMPYTLLIAPPGIAASRTLTATAVARIQ